MVIVMLAAMAAGHADETRSEVPQHRPPSAVDGPRHRQHRVFPVPVLKVEPGVGFTTGVRGRYIHRKPQDRLNRVVLDVVSRISVRATQQHEFRLRMRDLAARNEIIDVNFRFDLDPIYTYVGTTVPGPLTNADFSDPAFEIERLSAAPDLNYQLVLYDAPDRPWTLRGFIGWNFAFDRLRAAPGSAFATDHPESLGRSTRGTYYVGLSSDSRDNDWNPKRGGLWDISAAWGTPLAGGKTAWGRFNSSFRNYARLGLREVSLAHQVLAEALVGDAPFIALGEFSGIRFRDGIGGLDTGRGYVRRRFIGRTKIYTSAELRLEPFRLHLGAIPVVPGIKPFVDIGWVPRPTDSLLEAIHGSTGLGVYVVWDEFEVLRLDLGVSPEGFSFLMAADHAF